MTLPFSKRTTAATTVFACISATTQAHFLTHDQSLLAALGNEYYQLQRAYRMLLHQDTFNQLEQRDYGIAAAQTAISELNATVMAIAPFVVGSYEAGALSRLQILVANALASINNVVSAE